MSVPKTLLELAGADLTPARLDEACVVLIDYQNEYLTGALPLPAANSALGAAKRLLAAARAAKTPILHVVHRGRAGGLFDLSADRGAIIAAVAPEAGEAIVEKTLPNAFAHTDLEERIAATGRRKPIFAGFMTHMCVSASARAALDLGYLATVAADACATRDLPDGTGGMVAANEVHRVALAELADRFAIVARGAEWHAS